jgi:hypothetical protein
MNNEENCSAAQVGVHPPGLLRRRSRAVSPPRQPTERLPATTYLPTAHGGFVVSGGAIGREALRAVSIRARLAREDQR